MSNPSKTAKYLINSPDSVVSEALEGFVQISPNVSYLGGSHDITVAVRSDWDVVATNHVAIVCGGGSGKL